MPKEMNTSKQAFGLLFLSAPQIASLSRSAVTVRSIGHPVKFKTGKWRMCSDIIDKDNTQVFKPSPFHEYRVARSRRLNNQSSEPMMKEAVRSSDGEPTGVDTGDVTDATADKNTEYTEKPNPQKLGDIKKVRERSRAANQKISSTGLQEIKLKEASIGNGIHFASHEDLMKALQELENDPLQSEGGRIVAYRGSKTAKLMVIGEAPGEMEDKLGKPFVGRAGELLDKIFEYGGFDTETQIYVTNVVKRRPRKNRTPNAAEMQYYKPFLLEEIRLIQPAIIVLAGAVAAQAMLGPVSITKVRGKWYGGGTEPWVMPVFHPAYLLRNPIRKHDMVTDIEEIRNKYIQEVPHDMLSPLKR